MSTDSMAPLINGSPTANGHNSANGKVDVDIRKWDKLLKDTKSDNKSDGEFHGDKSLGEKQVKWVGLGDDLRRIFTAKNIPSVIQVLADQLKGKGLNIHAGAQLIGSLSDYSKNREAFIDKQVKAKYDAMLHPPLTYLGDAFQYRAADGKFNSVLHPQLGMAGTPYARTVPSKTPPLGALPDPADVYDKLMARDGKRESKSGLSSMLIYHATIIIHDIFRTNDADKNLSDTSSYLDLSPLYGYTEDMVREIRDEKFGCGLLKPDTFAEDRLLRQPPGVCIMLVMYNRYHNYAATQLKRINENGRFSIPKKFQQTKLLAIAADEGCIPKDQRTKDFEKAVEKYGLAWDQWELQARKRLNANDTDYDTAEKSFDALLKRVGNTDAIAKFSQAYDAAHKKHDDDLFQTARLITCGMYINVSIHDYLRALMGFHQYDTNFTLEPRKAMNHKNVSRGLGNQVTVEFNLMYRFHCAISKKDEKYTEDLMKAEIANVSKAADKAGKSAGGSNNIDLNKITMKQFMDIKAAMNKTEQVPPWLVEFGLPKKYSEKEHFSRNTITGLFDDTQMVEALRDAMQDPISNFGPRNVPQCLKNVEIMGLLQARKWEVSTLNDFREFFGMSRHETFESITKNVEIQNALRDLYEHPDKVELYPGIFTESDAEMSVDPGPSGTDSALWAAIFSDAITLVRSDRFYTVDWNTNSLTSWGMKEVSPDNEICKSSVFHRVLQRAFPEWFPYDSIRFFHPFYTVDKNRQYAVEQGYAANFNMLKTKGKTTTYDTRPSDPKKPTKPYYLDNYADIKAVLATPADKIIHPAFVNTANLPPKVAGALKILPSIPEINAVDSLENKRIIQNYFELQTRRIVQREFVKMGKTTGSKPGELVDVFLLDVTRDLAIPVVTRCIADFLGFSHQVRDVDNPHAPYTENEIYEHITNCQTFLSYNVDETKLLKRRTDFKNSMQFLLKLAEGGTILEASRYSVSKAFRFLGRHLTHILKGGSTPEERAKESVVKPLQALGQVVARRILDKIGDTGKAAAMLLLTALDITHIAVLAFTATLDHLLQGAYEEAKNGTGYDKAKCEWIKIQKLALQGGEKADEGIEEAINKAQRLSIKLPFIRKIIDNKVDLRLTGVDEPLDTKRVIICDIYEAMNSVDAASDQRHLIYASSLTKDLIEFNPKDIAFHGLTAMIKVMAQMKNLRRGHTSQGLVKKIEVDQTYEGYANFMAPGRMQMVASDAERAPIDLEAYRELKSSMNGSEEPDEMEQLLVQRVKDADKVFDSDVLKPKSDTYLSPSWDEMIPFPTTWKLRFEGYGPSTYGDHLDKLQPEEILDDIPPWYQPSGPSQVGGGFADGVIVGGGKAPKTKDTPAGKARIGPSGCGAPLALVTAAPKALSKIVVEATEGAGEYAGVEK